MSEQKPQKSTEQKSSVVPNKTSQPSKIPLLICSIALVLLCFIIVFMLYNNSSLKNERNQYAAAYNETQKVVNQCQDSNTAICLYGKTTAVDDYLSILATTLQVKPSTSYDIMLEVVPTKLASPDVAINTDCRPNNHHLYICQRMTSSTPKKLIESMLVSYDNLNPSIEYNVSVILTPRAVLVTDDSNPTDSQMVPSNNQAVVNQQSAQDQPQSQDQVQPQDQAQPDQVAPQENQAMDQQLPIASPEKVASN